MTDPSRDPRSTLRRDLLLLALAGALLLLPALGARDLWNPDEARYAQVAREMGDTGSLFVPQLNGRLYAQKPPLLFWSILAASLPFGEVTEASARLPSALAALAALLLVYRLGRRFFGRRAGWLAAVVFLTCVKVIWQGRFGQIDMLLTGLVTAAVWFWARAHTEDRPRLTWLFFLFAGLATLAKGPVGLLPPLLAILAYLGLTRDLDGLRQLKPGRGLLLWLAVVLLWLVPATLDAGWSYFQTMVFDQNVTRYADPWHHHQPWYYYLTVLPGDFFPWSFLLPTALVVGWQRLLGGTGGLRGAVATGAAGVEATGDKETGGGAAGGRDGAAERARRGYLFALCWVVVTLLFFSLSPAKRSVYIFTAYPALALLVGAGLDRLATAWRARGEARPGEPLGTGPSPTRGWLLWPLGLLTALLLAVAVALPPLALERPELPVLGRTFLWVLEGALVALAAGALVAWVYALRRRVVAATTALAFGMAAFGLAAGLYLLPRFDVFKSARPLSQELLARMGEGEEYGIYPRLDNTFLFYTGRRAVPLHSGDEVRAFLERPGRQWLLAERDDWSGLADPPAVTEVARDHDPKEGYLLLAEDAETAESSASAAAAEDSGAQAGGGTP